MRTTRRPMNFSDKELGNLSNGAAPGSLAQTEFRYRGSNIKFTDSTKGVQQGDIVPGAIASGHGSIALGGLRYDMYTNEQTLAHNKDIKSESKEHFGRTPTSAEGKQSFAFGGSCHAYGDWSFSGGRDSNAKGLCSLAGGSGSTAESSFSFAFGYNSNAIGYNSFSFGYDCFANTENSFVAGIGLKSSAACQSVFGLFNKGLSDTLLEVGNGSSGNPGNAFEVLMSGGFRSYGDSVFNGDVKVEGGCSLTAFQLNADFAEILDLKINHLYSKDGRYEPIHAGRIHVDGDPVSDKDVIRYKDYKELTLVDRNKFKIWYENIAVNSDIYEFQFGVDEIYTGSVEMACWLSVTLKPRGAGDGQSLRLQQLNESMFSIRRDGESIYPPPGRIMDFYEISSVELETDYLTGTGPSESFPAYKILNIDKVNGLISVGLTNGTKLFTVDLKAGVGTADWSAEYSNGSLDSAFEYNLLKASTYDDVVVAKYGLYDPS